MVTHNTFDKIVTKCSKCKYYYDNIVELNNVPFLSTSIGKCLKEIPYLFAWSDSEVLFFHSELLHLLIKNFYILLLFVYNELCKFLHTKLLFLGGTTPSRAAAGEQKRGTKSNSLALLTRSG